MFVGLIRDIAGELEAQPAWQMDVLDEDRQARFQAQASWGSAGVGSLGRRWPPGG